MATDELRHKEELRCMIEIFKNGEAVVLGANKKPLERLRPEELKKVLIGKKIIDVEVTPLSTFLEIESGAFLIGNVWYYYP